MGSDFSKNNNLSISTSRPFYRPGDTVQGAVILNVTQAFMCESIELMVLGREMTFAGGHQDTLEDVLPNQKGGCEILNVKLPIRGVGTIEGGQHQYPFSFVIPHTALGSFLVRADSMNAQVSYQLRASCRSKAILVPELRSRQYLRIIAPAPVLLSAVAPPPVSVQKSLSTMGINRGNVAIEFRLNQEDFVPGSTIKIDVAIRNNAPSALSQLRVRLRQVTDLFPSFRYEVDIAQADVDMALPSMATQQMALTLTVPQNTPHTVRGRVVKCQYAVICEGVVGGLLGSRIPTAHPINIHAAQPEGALPAEVQVRNFQVMQEPSVVMQPQDSSLYPPLPSYDESWSRPTMDSNVTHFADAPPGYDSSVS